MYREAPIKGSMFDYIEFTRILKHGAKDKDEQWELLKRLPNLKNIVGNMDFPMFTARIRFFIDFLKIRLSISEIMEWLDIHRIPLISLFYAVNYITAVLQFFFIRPSSFLSGGNNIYVDKCKNDDWGTNKLFPGLKK